MRIIEDIEDLLPGDVWVSSGGNRYTVKGGVRDPWDDETERWLDNPDARSDAAFKGDPARFDHAERAEDMPHHHGLWRDREGRLWLYSRTGLRLLRDADGAWDPRGTDENPRDAAPFTPVDPDADAAGTHGDA